MPAPEATEPSEEAIGTETISEPDPDAGPAPDGVERPPSARAGDVPRDPDAAQTSTTVEPPSEPIAPADCIEIDNPLYLDALPATYAVHIDFEGPPPEVDPIPESQQWEEGWILASPSGGLWLGYSPPIGTEATGLTLAINQAAREESVFGSLSRSSYEDALRGLSGEGPLERAAVACARGTDG